VIEINLWYNCRCNVCIWWWGIHNRDAETANKSETNATSGINKPNIFNW